MSDQPPLTVDAVEVFVASLRQRSFPINTIKSYAHDLRLFVQSVPADLPTVTAETIQDFLATFAHLSIATRRRRYSTLCAFYHWLIRHGVVEMNPQGVRQSASSAHVEWDGESPSPRTPEDVHRVSVLVAR